MELLDQLLIKRGENVDIFLTARLSQFAPTSRVLALHTELKAVLGRLQIAQQQQAASGGGAKGSTRAKGAILAEIERDVNRIAETARDMSTLSDVEKGYFLKPSRRELELVGAARVFVEKGTPIWDKFVAYELDANLLTEISADLADYDAAYGSQQGDRQERIAAGGSITEDIARLNEIVAELRQPVKNKFAGQESVLLAWASAIRYPERDKTPKTPPTPPTS